MQKAASRKRRDINPAHIYDIETEDWTKFVCGVHYDLGASRVTRYDWRQEKAFADVLLSSDGEVWAHNGGRFDHRWLLRHILERKISCRALAAGSRFVRIDVNKVSLLDSKALIPMSLKELTSDGEEKKTECPIPYDQIRRTMVRADMGRVLDYCEQDCIALADGIRRIREFSSEFDLDLGSTIGGAAYRCASRWLELGSADFTAAEHKRLRCAYYGGRTEPYQVWAEQVYEADINQAYPDALNRTELPVGKRRWIDDAAKAFDAFQQREPGIYAADIRISAGMHIPPMPARTRHGLLYPTGTWSGWYTEPELRHAVDCGAVVVVKAGCVWEGAEIVFSPWIAPLSAERVKRGKKSSIGRWIKWYQNSLTGKLGQRPERKDIVFCPADGPRAGWDELSSDPQIFAVPQQQLSACMHIHWAAYLTAVTRVKLHQKQLEVKDGRDMVYSDTDSILAENPRSGIGDQLGQWEAGGPYKKFLCLAPKVYSYEGKVRAKGIPLPEETSAKLALFDRLRKGATHEWSTPGGWKSSLKVTKGVDPFVKQLMSRKLQPIEGWLGGRIINSDGRTTRPPHIGE